VHIGIFSKLEYAGGSEFRCAEMANGITRVAGCRVTLLAEKKIAPQVREAVTAGVELVEGVMSTPRLLALEAVDHLLVVNTDSKEFAHADYWQGRTPRHARIVHLERLRSLTFLFNFIVSPARHLATIKPQVDDLRIITANQKFFREISEQSRYADVRHYPRLCLESPINTQFVQWPKTPAPRLRFGMHSRAMSGKWNSELATLIETVNREHGDRVSWDFMGMPEALARTIGRLPNVRARPEFDVPVGEYLSGIDVFVYFPHWKREEPWSRSVAEALTSGCPVITTDKGGNRDQVLHGNNGLLCRTTQEFAEACGQMVGNAAIYRALQRNALAGSRRFATSEVIDRFLDFVR
jgi:hypothetical protein